jgi:hypothetical protein
MALLSEEMDNDLLRLWALVAELSDQLNNNRAMTAALQAQANQVKVWCNAGCHALTCLTSLIITKGQAIHSGTGFVLRRFNTDLTKGVLHFPFVWKYKARDVLTRYPQRCSSPSLSE